MEFNYVDNPQRFSVLEKGVYEAQCVSFEYGTSKAGNQQVVLSLKIYHDDEEVSLRDWLPNTSGSQWKVKAFTEAVGQIYEKGGTLDMDRAINKLFRVVINKKPRTDQPDQMQNNVEGYLPLSVEEKKDAFEGVF
jgi:hypothetical protein